MKKLKVVVICTGNVASIAARCLQGRNDVELVGVRDTKKQSLTTLPLQITTSGMRWSGLTL